jgi:hypothetical protein
MIDPTRQDNQIPLLQPNPHPIVVLTPDIEKSCTIQNITNLLILVQMLVEETLHLLFINVTHFLGRNGDLIPVLVVALLGKRLDFRVRADVMIDYAKVGEVGWVDRTPRVVGEALVTLEG